MIPHPRPASLLPPTLLALLLACSALPSLETVERWEVTSYAGWPGVGLAALLFLTVGGSGRRTTLAWLAAQTVGLGLVLGVVYDVGPLLGLVGSLAVTVPALVTARWVRPGTAAYRRFNEGEVDAYHGVTALSGLLCAALTAAAAVAADRGDPAQVLLTAGIAFFAASTAQLVTIPFWLRSAGGWRLAHSVELWAQRSMLLVFLAGIFAFPSTPPVGFLVFPILGWAAIRARAPETHLQVALASGAAFLSTLAGRGPFALGSASDPSPFTPLLVYMFIASICYLLIPLALTVERLVTVTRQATRAATTVTRMLDSATGTVFIATDPSGTITHYSPGAQQALGFAPDAVLGRHSSTLHSPAEVARHAEALGEDAGPSGTETHAETYLRAVTAQITSGRRSDWLFLHRDGGDRAISLTISAMSDSGRLVGYIASGEDSTDRITTQRALEQALERERASVEALRAADKVKQDLVSTVSHELRTPITNVAGYVELLLDGELGDMPVPQVRAVERIQRNSHRLRHLVDDLLTLSRAEAATEPVATEVVDLNDVATAAHDHLRSQVGERALEVRLGTPRTPVPVRGNREMLERVVVNLLGNAVKFTPDGGSVDLRVELDPPPAAAEDGDGTASPAGGRASAPHAARIVVLDTGLGIPAADHQAVFERFYRSSAADEHAIQGTGLGLSIVRAIVEQHHGTVVLDSRPGVGTSVTVRLPLAGAG
ncbi:ATP-binding protein [Nocardioides sp. Arc9.136]|uniref:ATP-binding protein n=1 Tax=Nocardioides sp. Arc9.136 TaxID=2996826 RepID=UPI00266678C2|nr:ATP-binding protein [Nocardioides sp. Arc9.136]WKN46937.1 ATP-binding protein [Nocardioides sp. Arc9.136]